MGVVREVKTIRNFHNIAVKPNSLTAWIENLIDYFVHYYSKAFVSPSQSCSESIRARPILVNSEKITFIIDGVEVKRI